MSLKDKAVKGVKWNTLSTLYNVVIQLLRLAILTRLLEKSDFGLVAIAMMVISFTDLFSDLGLTVAIIHKQGITEKQYSSVFWLNIIMSVLLFLLTWYISPFLAIFYSEPILTKVIPLLGLQILFNAFGKMFQTIKIKNLEFNFISKVRILSVTIGFIITIFLAWTGWGIYSLVFGQLSQVVTNQFIFVLAGLKQQKVLFYFNFNEILDFIKIGSYQLGARFLDLVSSKIDVFLIGRFFNMDDLGVYNLAKELILRPVQVIISLVNNVASSVFSKLQKNVSAVRNNYLKLLNITTAITIPIYAATFIFADVIVSVLYSSNFSEVAVFLRVLSILGVLYSIDSLAGTLQIAFGRTDIGFKWTMVRVVLSSIAILIASKYSILSVAYSQSIVAIISYFLYWRIAIYPIVRINLIEYVDSVKRSFVISFSISILFFILSEYFNFDMKYQLVLFTMFFIVHLLYYMIFQKDFFNSIFRLIFKK